jgi:hypothetical protein
MKLHVTISKTSDGLSDYIQLMSDDAVTVNVVLVADKIEVQDARESAPAEPKVCACCKRVVCLCRQIFGR